MNLKGAIEQILPHYEKAVIEMPKKGHYKWLYNRDMEFGLCHFSIMILCKGITNKMIKEIGTDRYIGNGRPSRHYTYEENLKQIQNRVEWMREYLSKN